MQSKDVKKISIVIIESLRPEDKKTGSILYNETIKYKQYKEENLTSELHQVHTKKELIELLLELIRQAKRKIISSCFISKCMGIKEGFNLVQMKILVGRNYFLSSEK